MIAKTHRLLPRRAVAPIRERWPPTRRLSHHLAQAAHPLRNPSTTRRSRGYGPQSGRPTIVTTAMAAFRVRPASGTMHGSIARALPTTRQKRSGIGYGRKIAWATMNRIQERRERFSTPRRPASVSLLRCRHLRQSGRPAWESRGRRLLGARPLRPDAQRLYPRISSPWELGGEP